MNLQKTYSVEQATKILEKYCVYQERCHQEVEAKLVQMKMIPLAKQHIIAHLITHDFLNEERFALTFVRGKFNAKKWGRIRLVRELKLRKISEYNIKKALSQISEHEYLMVFNDLVNKKLSTLKSMEKQKARKQLSDYLLYRGWEASLVYEKVFDSIV